MPCHFLDHIIGFARITKYLAYNNEGHVCEFELKRVRRLAVCNWDRQSMSVKVTVRSEKFVDEL